MKAAEKILRKTVDSLTKTKKNGPPRLRGGANGGRTEVTAPESWRREFSVLHDPVVTDNYLLETFGRSYGHSSMHDNAGDVRNNPEVDRLLEEEQEQLDKSKRPRPVHTPQGRGLEKKRRRRERDGGPYGDVPGRREGERPQIIPIPVPDIPDMPPPDDGPPDVIPGEPDFDIPDDDDKEDDEDDREEDVKECEEIEEYLRLAGIEVTLCGGAAAKAQRIVGSLRRSTRKGSRQN